MKTKTNNIYLYLTIGFVLLTIISFHFFTNFSTYWKQPAVQKETFIGETRFELLDYQISPYRCWHGHEKENFYLFAASSNNRTDLIQFLQEFKPQNSCNAWIFFQRGKTIDKTWKQAARLKPLEVALPQSSFAHSFYQASGFILTNLSEGKVNGKFRQFHSDGRLFVEQEIKNNIAAGKRKIYYPTFRVEQVWKNKELISTDTIRLFN